MATNGRCVNGTLVTTLYTSPVPLIGLYIIVATSVCLFCMTFDLMYGLFKIKMKPFLPCKWFPMNAFTLTVLAVAAKIPNDLVTAMPSVEDQLSKLTGAALLCTSLGFYMPSLGTMGTSERYSNLAALSVTVITMVVNLRIQIYTGVIFLFTTEHIIIMVCSLVLLLLMWSSAIKLTDQIDYKRYAARLFLHDFKDKVEDLKGLRDLVGRAHTFHHKFNPQTMLCKTPNHHTLGLLCVLSLVVVSQSMLRYWFAPKSIETCNTARDVSDYKWSIPFVIWSQFLTILVGSSCIICRWFSLLRRLNKSLLEVGCPQMELESLRLKTLPPLISFLNKKLFNVLVVAKDFFMDYVLIPTQIILYKCNIFLVGKPIHYVIHCGVFHESSSEDDTENDPSDDTYRKELRSYRDSCKWDSPTNLLALIFKCPPGNISSECAPLMGKLEATGKEYLGKTEGIVAYDYRVSCVSVLVLSGILAELMPPSTPRTECIMQSLKESFEIIYFVDQKTKTPIWDNERRWMSTKEVWTHWENPTHWFRTKIIKKFNLKQVDDLGVLDTLDAVETYFQEKKERLWKISHRDSSLTEKHLALVSIEFAIICKFIRQQSCESVKDLFDFLERCFVKMLCFTLSSFPLAILNEMDGDDPYEIDEGRIRKALKYCYKLDYLSDKMEWSWQAESGHIHAFFPTATAAKDYDYDGIIPTIGSNDEKV